MKSLNKYGKNLLYLVLRLVEMLLKIITLPLSWMQAVWYSFVWIATKENKFTNNPINYTIGSKVINGTIKRLDSIDTNSIVGGERYNSILIFDIKQIEITNK